MHIIASPLGLDFSVGKAAERRFRAPARGYQGESVSKIPNPTDVPRATVPLHRRVSAGSPQAYALAAVLTALAGLLRWALGLIASDVLPMAPFYPAVLFAALLGGRGPGIFAALFGGLLGWWAFLPQYYSFGPLTPGQQIGLALYGVASLVIVWGADHYRKLTKRVEDEENLRKLATEELAHRLKNKVATIQAILRYRLRDDPKLAADIAGCLSALSATDELIVSTQGRGAGIRDILIAELGPYAVTRAIVDGPNVLLVPRLAMTMAMVFHELLTNSAKYGALSGAAGRVSVQWSISGTRLGLEWSESGGPVVAPPTRRGFGMRLLATALMQFDGGVDTIFEPSGLVCKMNISLPEHSVLVEQLSPLVAA
jgi:two-component sensor histidine kinase